MLLWYICHCWIFPWFGKQALSRTSKGQQIPAARPKAHWSTKALLISCYSFFQHNARTLPFLIDVVSGRVWKENEYAYHSFLKHMDTQKHFRAKFAIICAIFYFVTQNRQNRNVFMFWYNSTKFCQIFHVFLAFLVHYIRQNSVCAKQFTFRRSDAYIILLGFSDITKKPNTKCYFPDFLIRSFVSVDTGQYMFNEQVIIAWCVS